MNEQLKQIFDENSIEQRNSVAEKITQMSTTPNKLH